LARQEPKVDATAPRRPGMLAQGIEWELRIDALIAAGRLGDASILAEVIPLLSHGEAAMREAATFTIGRTGDRRAIPYLVKALNDRRDSVQTLACLGLAQVVDAKSVPAAVAVVADGNRNDSVRAACAYALGIQRAASSSSALSIAVTDNRGRASRLAAWALGQIGDHRATPDLLHAYFGRAQPDGSELLWAIARVSAAGLSPSTVANLQDYPVRADRFDSVQRMTTLPGPLPVAPIPEAFLLGYETQIGDALLAALAEHRDVALNALSDLNAKDASDASDRHIALRGVAPASPSDRAAAALDRIGVRIVPALERLLIRDDAETRAAAIFVLAKAAAPSSPQLEQKLAIGFLDKSPLVRERAMQAVAIVSQRLGRSPPLLVRLLREALLRASWQDRRIAALALGQLAPDLSVGALAAAAGDPSGLVREAVAQALGRGAPGAIEPLIILSADPVSSVRAAAAAGLARQRDERARSRLRELASDPSPEVRSATQ
jgi:HEAT repeat protein